MSYRSIALLTVVILPFRLSSQNVGIGTANPTEKLHVAGNIKADTIKPNALKIISNAGSGKVLTSDQNGNGSWQTSSAAASGNLGYGVWGDCATNANLSEYNPVADTIGEAGDTFGNSVDISGNFAIIGNHLDNVNGVSDKGSVSIYRFDGTSWVHMQTLTDPNGNAGDQLGISVSISGNYAIAGAWTDNVGSNPNQGSAVIFEFNGTDWIYKQKITDPAGSADDNFGNCVDLAGDYLIVGAHLDDENSKTDQGSASIFKLSGSTWMFERKLSVFGHLAGAHFGHSVSISYPNAIVGAPYNTFNKGGTASLYTFYASSNTTYITHKSGTYEDENMGFSVSIDNNTAIVGRPGSYSLPGIHFNNYGLISIFLREVNEPSWTLTQELSHSLNHHDPFFGYNVAISGNYIICGIPGANAHQGSLVGPAGATVIFQRVGTRWQQLQFFKDPGANMEETFGQAVNVDAVSRRFIVGVKNAPPGGKVVFGKIN